MKRKRPQRRIVLKTQDVAARTTSRTPTLLLRPEEAADALAVSARTLWTLTDQGSIPCVRLGRSVRYDIRDLMEWIDANKTGDAQTEEE